MSDKPVYRPAPVLMPQSGRRIDKIPERMGGPSLTSESARARLVETLRGLGISQPSVLAVMARVPRHLFVDEAFASRAYEEAALPIGYKQTISRPFTVARYAEHALQGRSRLGRVLEVGAGCGYQAAVFSEFCAGIVSIERIEALYAKARANLLHAGYPQVQVLHGDGLLGYPPQAPFDVIIVAAAGLDVPEALLKQLKVGGRLIVPLETQGQQVLTLIDRVSENHWKRETRDLVKFVPLLQGVRDF
ncbi:MAG: protein-L-isoaspartate(D-aspartate) O-methyltransferase [Limnobacter sp.]|nr:protein-L-isoaspartate(D-aspartate) O-methyltransferase [Limnobacter sp.]